MCDVLFPPDPSRKGLDYFFAADFAILHFRAASGWDKKDGKVVDDKWELIRKALEEAFRLQEQDDYMCGVRVLNGTIVPANDVSD